MPLAHGQEEASTLENQAGLSTVSPWIKRGTTVSYQANDESLNVCVP